MRVVGAAVIADISGSTSLYEGTETRVALGEIRARVDRIQQVAEQSGGTFIHSKGDDVLAFFENPNAAVEAAKLMIANRPEDILNVHGGVAWGNMLQQDGDLYGRPVNAAARLASLAKPLEVLVAESCFEILTPAIQGTLRVVDRLRLKGEENTKAVHSFVADDPMERTQLFVSRLGAQATTTRISLSHLGTEMQFGDGRDVKIGRADDNDLVVPAPWVSRSHATISVANGLVEFRDHSSGGSFLIAPDGRETLVRRSAITLSGLGTIAFGAPARDAGNAVIGFAVERA